MTSINFTLPTMTCGHCERTVTQTVQRVDPQAHLSIDLAAHEVRIESQQPADAFKRALSDEGYPPQD